MGRERWHASRRPFYLYHVTGPQGPHRDSRLMWAMLRVLLVQ